MALSLQTLLPILLDKTPVELKAISDGAEKVVFGLTTSIGALNQNATFDRDDAGIVLEACRQARLQRARDPSACSASAPAPALGHGIRVGRQTLWGA